QPLAGQEAFQSEIAHHRGDYASALESALQSETGADQGHDLVSIDHSALLVHDDQPVRIAVESNADICPFLDHPRLQRSKRSGTDAVIDVEPVRFDADCDGVRAKLPDRARRHRIGGAVGAIDDHLEPVEPDLVGQGLLDRVYVAPAGILDPARPPDM